MKYTEAKLGRVFILRLEHNDVIPDVIEEFSRKEKISNATVQFIGGADRNSKIVVGPEDGKAPKPKKMVAELEETHEVLGFGTIISNKDNNPILHMHAAFGRKECTITGCVREGVNTWLIGEVIVTEILTDNAKRLLNDSGFELLEITK